MAVARHLAAFNRRVFNPFIRTFAGKVPPLAVIRHRGRTSGRQYRTPVIALPIRDGYAISLLYGAHSDWVRNVLAAGGCALERRGRLIELTDARPLGQEAVDLLPAAVRPALRLAGPRRFLMLTIADGARPDDARPDDAT